MQIDKIMEIFHILILQQYWVLPESRAPPHGRIQREGAGGLVYFVGRICLGRDLYMSREVGIDLTKIAIYLSIG